ncbi:MAG: hypothetical protein AAB614_03035 [Patescibacteria group bacterium]
MFHSNLERKTSNEIIKLEISFYVIAFVAVAVYLVVVVDEVCAFVPFILTVLILSAFKFNKMLYS